MKLHAFLHRKTLKRCILAFFLVSSSVYVSNFLIFNFVHEYRINPLISNRRYDFMRVNFSMMAQDHAAEDTAAGQFGFETVHSSPSTDLKQPFLVVLVCSSPHDTKHRALRQAIRETWKQACKEPVAVDIPQSDGKDPIQKRVECLVVFYAGRTNDEHRNILMDEESKEYGDLLLVDSFDSYYKITDKLLVAFQWASHLEPTFVMKTDDDIYVNIKRLMEKLASDETLPRDLYGGHLYYGNVMRDKTHRHYISKEEFPDRSYPPYCKGAQYVFAGHLLPKFLKASTFIPRLKIDDAYVGIVMRSVGVTAISLHQFAQFSWLEFFVDFLSPCEYATLISLGDSLNPRQMHKISQGMATYENANVYCVHFDGWMVLVAAVLLAVAMAWVASKSKQILAKPKGSNV